jgi:hypothetical protein
MTREAELERELFLTKKERNEFQTQAGVRKRETFLLKCEKETLSGLLQTAMDIIVEGKAEKQSYDFEGRRDIFLQRAEKFFKGGALRDEQTDNREVVGRR